jgi:hypothetical protein
MARRLLYSLQRRPRRCIVLYIASTFLALAALLWFALAITMAGLLSGDPLSRSLARGFTNFLGLGAWTMILGLALIATIVTGPKSLAALAALAALCSVVALFCTSDVLNQRHGPSWLILPTLLSPALVGLLVAGALFPRLSFGISTPQQLWTCATAVVLLSLMVVPYWLSGRRANAEETARIDLLKSQTAAPAHQ